MVALLAPHALAPAPAPVAALIAAAPTVHPALLLAWELRERERSLGGELPIDDLIEAAPAIEAAIAAGREALAAHEHILHTLRDAPAMAAHAVPEGF